MARRIGTLSRRVALGVLGVGVLAAYGGMIGGARDGERLKIEEKAMQVRFLEIVTPEMEATCAALGAVHGVSFGEPVAELGNARTAMLAGGGVISVRAPMAEHETPVVRPYVLVDDIEAAVKEAEAKGAMIAHPPLEIPGQGTFAIYILGGIQHGLWED